MLIDGGLSIPDALTTDATGIIAIQGHLLSVEECAKVSLGTVRALGCHRS